MKPTPKLQDQLRAEIERTVKLDVMHSDAAAKIDALEAALFASHRELDQADVAAKRQITNSTRKLAAAQRQRDEWREAALRYQKTIIELKKKLHETNTK